MDCGPSANHGISSLLLCHGSIILCASFSAETIHPLLLPPHFPSASISKAPLGNRYLRYPVRHCLHCWGNISMPPDIILLESMGRTTQGQMLERQWTWLGERNNQHFTGCVDAWSRYLPVGSPPTALEEVGWSRIDVCCRNIVSVTGRARNILFLY